MSKLDSLIQKLCPDGVKYESIYSLIKRKRQKVGKDSNISQVYVISNTLGMVKAEEYRENTVHSEDISNYLIVEKGMCAYNPSRLNIGSIAIMKDNIGAISPMYVVFSINYKIVNEKYFEYLLESTYVKNKINAYKEEGARFRFDFERWDWIKVPIPPLEVQEEIVSILDKITELSYELSAELKARQKHYEYYKNLLLNTKGEIKKLGEVASFKTGSKPKNIFENKNVNYFEYINAGTTNSGYVDQTNSFKGAVTTPSRGQGGIGFVGYQAQDFWLGPLCYAIYSNDNNILKNKYLYYELSSKKDEILKRKNTGGVPSLNGCDLKTIPINIPPIDKQLRIINNLDKFENICEDISKEIVARRKQYKYYRDKLLNFKELKVEE